MSLSLTVDVYDVTPDQAGALVDLIDRAGLKISDETYDDLLLVASGHADLVRDAATSNRQTKPKATCVACGKSFDALRPKRAKYCSNACRGKTARRAANGPETGIRYPSKGVPENRSYKPQDTGALEPLTARSDPSVNRGQYD
jgi:hypothetical protein